MEKQITDRANHWIDKPDTWNGEYILHFYGLK